MSAWPSWHKGILYNNPVRSDVVIKCGSHEIHAHKVILMAASGLFYTAFNSNFSVAEASTYEIDGYEPEIVESMIRYIYKSPPPDKPFEKPYYKPSNWPSDCTLDWTLQCFAIANEYQVPSLCRAVTEYITESCAKHVEKLKSCNKHDKTFSFSRRRSQVAQCHPCQPLAVRTTVDAQTKRQERRHWFFQRPPFCKNPVSSKALQFGMGLTQGSITLFLTLIATQMHNVIRDRDNVHREATIHWLSFKTHPYLNTTVPFL